MRLKELGKHHAKAAEKNARDEKDLRRLSRKDLLEILVEQSRRIDELTEEVAALRGPEHRELTSEELDDLVAAARRVNRVYAAVDAAPPAAPVERDAAGTGPRHARGGL